MEEKTISFRQGKGSLAHNNRTFIAENVHKEKIKDNVTFISQPIQEAYQLLFSEATLRHNSQQKRNDRKFDDYYQHLFRHDYSNNVIQSSNGEKSFYEDIMQSGEPPQAVLRDRSLSLTNYLYAVIFFRKSCFLP